MNIEEVNAAIIEALEIEIEEFVADKKLEEYENYDSLALLTLMTLLEDGGIVISADDLDTIECASDIYKLAGAA